jgi:type II secretory ATPase GspE/PulE/Tfp pilus assembly ATPase PilB-like protein
MQLGSHNTSVISVVDDIIHKAIVRGVSDIHFEPTDHGLRVRFRIDGVLVDQPMLSDTVMAQILSRLKILAAINIAERRMPQDGKFSVHYKGAPIDLRVSTFPSLFGQKVVIRILDRATHMISLPSLGFEKPMLDNIKHLIHRPHGFFLVTGPTGSGKTTTLYAALSDLNSPTKNIVTLEDPVEYSVSGVIQGHINPEVGFTFEQGVRAVLRQDPDIIMVGEIRDRQTAHVAIEAALTGHSVLSTLHTNDAPSAIMRLMDMGIEPFLINASLTGVLAQRLVRTICTGCRISGAPTQDQTPLMQRYGIETDVLYTGKGCVHCDGYGYKGRTGIFELLVMHDELRSLIIKQPAFESIYAQVRKQGTQSLLQSAVKKVQEGVITLQEMMRVVA